MRRAACILLIISTCARIALCQVYIQNGQNGGCLKFASHSGYGASILGAQTNTACPYNNLYDGSSAFVYDTSNTSCTVFAGNTGMNNGYIQGIANNLDYYLYAPSVKGFVLGQDLVNPNPDSGGVIYALTENQAIRVSSGYPVNDSYAYSWTNSGPVQINGQNYCLDITWSACSNHPNIVGWNTCSGSATQNWFACASLGSGSPPCALPPPSPPPRALMRMVTGSHFSS